MPKKKTATKKQQRVAAEHVEDTHSPSSSSINSDSTIIQDKLKLKEQKQLQQALKSAVAGFGGLLEAYLNDGEQIEALIDSLLQLQQKHQSIYRCSQLRGNLPAAIDDTVFDRIMYSVDQEAQQLYTQIRLFE